MKGEQPARKPRREGSRTLFQPVTAGVLVAAALVEMIGVAFTKTTKRK